MHIMTKCGSQDNIVTYEHICDTFEDIQSINPHYITLGSTCIVINGDSGGLEIYMANSNKEWESISITGGESSNSSLPIQILGSNDYDSVTGIPTIESPIENIIYLVPSNDDTNDMYKEWIYTDDNWEIFGSGGNIEIPEQLQADWNQSNSNSKDYIKNKPGSVRYDEAQNLTAVQQQQARENIGALTDNFGAANEGKALVVDEYGGVALNDNAISDDLKAALVQLAQKIVYVDSGGQQYYNALYRALYNKYPAMYSMGDGIYTSTNGAKATVTGNHVRLETAQNYGAGIENLNFNSAKKVVVENEISVLNDNPKWVTLPAGNAVLNIKNIINQSDFLFIVGVRDAGGNTNVIASGEIGNGGSTQVEAAFNTAKDIGAIVVYVHNRQTSTVLHTNAVLEFDVELYVDDVRYI